MELVDQTKVAVVKLTQEAGGRDSWSWWSKLGSNAKRKIELAVLVTTL
jgi:hypothetical protein